MDFNEIMKETRKNESFKNIIIFDISHLFSRHIFSLAARKQKDGLTNSEMYICWKNAVLNNIFTLIKKYKSDEVIIAYDKKIDGKYWRTDIFPDYKGQRKALADANVLVDFKEFNPIKFDFQKDFIEAFTTIKHIELDRIEADDIAAILCKNLNNVSITIITSDQDYKQLLQYKNVKIFDPIKRKDMTTFDWKKELTIKVVVGDGSDNIPNIKKGKAGPKTAELIATIGLDNWIEKVGFHETEKPEIRAQYALNRKLIDMSYIPSDIENKIMENYNNYKLKRYNITKAIKFCQKHKLADAANQLLSSNISNILFELK